MKKFSLEINLLGILSGICMVVAMFIPWWSITLEGMGTTELYPYLLDGPLREVVGYKKSPQMELLSNVLIACIAICFVGSFLRTWLARLCLSLSGLVIMLASWRLVARVEQVAGRFNVPIQGHGFASYQGFALTEVWTQLHLGLYLILIGAGLALIAAILHNKIKIKLF